MPLPYTPRSKVSAEPEALPGGLADVEAFTMHGGKVSASGGDDRMEAYWVQPSVSAQACTGEFLQRIAIGNGCQRPRKSDGHQA